MTNDLIRHATQQMYAAGFTPEEFTVNVERIYSPELRRRGFKNPYTYGAAEITVEGDSNALIEARKDALLAAGLGVDKMLLKNKTVVWLIRTEPNFAGKFREISVGR